MSFLQSKPTADEAITKAYFSEFSLSIDKEKMAFLIGIYVFSKYQKEPSLSFGNLSDVFEKVNRLIQGDDDTLLRRAKNAVVNLCEQGLLSRMAGVGGEQYGLSPLGHFIAQHWEKNETLTTQTLVQFMQHLRMVLEPLRDKAQEARAKEVWNEEIVPLLREIIGDLINGISRRQHGMAQTQKLIQKDIQDKIDKDWLVAIESCEEMLKETGAALEELYKVIVSGTDSVISILDDISDEAGRSGHMECLGVVESLQAQMEGIRQWSNAAHKDWSDYYRNVHDYIRIHVRTDPNRQAAFRIKEGISFFATRPWSFSVPDPEPFYRLREDAFPQPVSQVKIPGKVQVPEIEEADVVENILLQKIEEEIERQMTEEGKASLVGVLKKIAPEVTDLELFQAAGQLVSLLAKLGRPRPFVELDWSPVVGSVEVQDLTVLAAGCKEGEHV